MKDKRAGFTLIELLVVIGILSLLIATFAPQLIQGKNTANIAADAQNMRTIFGWIETGYKQKSHGMYPSKGGCRFVLAPWTDGVVERTPDNFDRFFNPALRGTNTQYSDWRKGDLDHLWMNSDQVDSTCTDYAGRAKEFMKGLDSGKEAWIADDNEDGWCFKDGTINVLYGSGNVEQITSMDLRDKYDWPEIEQDKPFPTFGPESPAVDLRKLDK